MSDLKKCDKCGEGYYGICLSCIPIYNPPPNLTGGPKRYGNVGKSLFSQGRPHPLTAHNAQTGDRDE